MDFVNHTPFPAQDFEGVDQHDQRFHVLALRQTLRWSGDGTLTYADEQFPLCEEDLFSGVQNESCVLQESDYCHYKPKCDVLVNASAYAPLGKPMRRFEVRLVVRRPDAIAPSPPRPHGLNQFVEPSHTQLEEWMKLVSEPRILPGKRLVDKRLEVTGERRFVRHIWPLRLAFTLLKFCSLGLIRLPTWRLTMPAPTTVAPASADFAFGGSCRIDSADDAARRVRKKHRLTSEQLTPPAAPDDHQVKPAVARSAFECNPAGRGFAERWYVSAKRISTIPAPQIEDASTRVSASHFMRCLDGRMDEDMAASLSVGFGVRPKCHPRRRRLAGTADDAFARGQAWLPADFDFAIWNAAAPNQQTDFLKGDETIELMNLCAPHTAGTRIDECGNTILTLTLPANECHVLVRLLSGEMYLHPMVIDTVIVDPEQRQLSLVWRTVLSKTDEAPVRAVEARMYSFGERDRIRAKIEELKEQMKSSSTKASYAEDAAHG